MDQNIEAFNEDCLWGLDCMIQSNSIDVICTDPPPYLYLKGQKLEREFNEQIFFSECKRALKSDGFIVLFGRGTSFYRWNTILADLGFKFKEEVVWDKIYTTSPVLKLQRCHETASIWVKGNASINRVKIDYLEANSFDPSKMQRDIKRIMSALNSEKGLKNILNFLEDGNAYTRGTRGGSYDATTIQNNSTQESQVEKSMFKMLIEGVNEKSIIRQVYDRYKRIHPTQKPVRLLERLLALVSKPGDTILDPFAGSFSTAIACHNMKLKFIGFEIDKEYYEAGIKRIKEL